METQELSMDEKKPITCVLAGHDHNGAFKDEIKEIAKENSATIISARDWSINEAIGHIPKGIPVHIYLACHGSEDGTFRWSDSDSKGPQVISYKEFSSKLRAAGIDARIVTVGSCFGGSSVAAIKDLPAGTILHSAVSAKSYSNSDIGFKYAERIHGLNTPVDLAIASLLAVTPEEVAKNNKMCNEKDGVRGTTEDPKEILPDSIVIGGGKEHLPQIIYLPNKSKALISALHNHSIDEAAFNRAVERVKYVYVYSSPIDALVKQMRQGIVSQSPMENRGEYALTLAYMHETGELSRRIVKSGGKPEIPEPMEKYDAAQIQRFSKSYADRTVIEEEIYHAQGAVSNHYDYDDVRSVVDKIKTGKPLKTVQDKHIAQAFTDEYFSRAATSAYPNMRQEKRYNQDCMRSIEEALGIYRLTSYLHVRKANDYDYKAEPGTGIVDTDGMVAYAVIHPQNFSDKKNQNLLPELQHLLPHSAMVTKQADGSVTFNVGVLMKHDAKNHPTEFDSKQIKKLKDDISIIKATKNGSHSSSHIQGISTNKDKHVFSAVTLGNLTSPVFGSNGSDKERQV